MAQTFERVALAGQGELRIAISPAHQAHNAGQTPRSVFVTAAWLLMTGMLPLTILEQKIDRWITQRKAS